MWSSAYILIIQIHFPEKKLQKIISPMAPKHKYYTHKKPCKWNKNIGRKNFFYPLGGVFFLFSTHFSWIFLFSVFAEQKITFSFVFSLIFPSKKKKIWQIYRIKTRILLYPFSSHRIFFILILLYEKQNVVMAIK